MKAELVFYIILPMQSVDLAGGGRGAVCDLANCAERGRLGPNNEVLYTVRGECESVWADRPALVGSR